MICPKCGSAIDDNARFCTYCGQMTAPQQTPEPEPVPEPTPEMAAAAVTKAAEEVAETPVTTEASVNRCEYWGTEMEEGARLCPACGATMSGIGDIPLEKASDVEDIPEQPYAAAQPEQPYAAAQPEQSYAAAQTEQPYAAAQPEQPYAPAQTEQPYTAAQPEQSYAAAQTEQPYAPAQPEQPYAPAQPEQPYAAAQPEQPYAAAQPEQPYPAAQPQQPYAAAQPQPQYIQPPAPQPYGQPQYAQPAQPQMYSQGGQMPYAQQPYGAYPAQQPVYPGAVNPAGETPNIPAAIIILLADIALAVSFFLNMLFGTVGYGGKAELSLFRLYEYFGQAIEAVKTIFELIGKSGVELDKINFGQIFPGELWIAVGITSAVYILFLISFINVIVAIVRVFTARGPRVTYFWGSAGAVAGTAFSAYLIAFGGCILFNLRASGILDGITGAKYKEVIGVNWLFYVMFGVSLAAVILSGVMKSMVKKKYMMNPGPYRTKTPPRTNMY